VELPLMYRVRQDLPGFPLGEETKPVLESEIEMVGFGAKRAGATVAVAVGSRGIDNRVEVVAGLVEALVARGLKPYIVPAMGSHGGATARGQECVLRELGISPQTVGAPIVPSMETVELGVSPGGAEVHFSAAAMEADVVVAVNRIAPHTVYAGLLQSGLAKMLAVGLGKEKGARSIHRHGFGAGHLIGEAAEVVTSGIEVLGIGLIEDGLHRLAKITALPGEEITEKEPGLLDLAKGLWPTLPFGEIDILIVDEMGKDISGVGMDPYVTGRGKEFPPEGPQVQTKKLVALGLTGASGGNATGVGLADIISSRLYRSVDSDVTNRNVEVSGETEKARIPVVAENDRRAIEKAIESVGVEDPEELRVVRLENTRSLGEYQVSGGALGEMHGLAGLEVSGLPELLKFDAGGTIVPMRQPGG
jgi:hypothetical protein